MPCPEGELHLFSVVWRVHNYCSVTFVGWKYDNIRVLTQILESVSLLFGNGWWWWLGFAEESSYLYTGVICLFWWESIDGWFYLTNYFLLWNFIRRYCKVRANAETIMRDRLLLDRFLTVLNREDWELLCGLRLLYFFIYRSVDCIWMFWYCLYVMRSKICQMSCRM